MTQPWALAEHLYGAADGLESLRTLAAGCDVLTFDHERIPTRHLQTLEAEGIRLAPTAAAVRLAQDKLASRRELRAKRFPVQTSHTRGRRTTSRTSR